MLTSGNKLEKKGQNDIKRLDATVVAPKGERGGQVLSH